MHVRLILSAPDGVAVPSCGGGCGDEDTVLCVTAAGRQQSVKVTCEGLQFRPRGRFQRGHTAVLMKDRHE